MTALRSRKAKEKYLGPEPDTKYKFDTQAQIARALSWYNYFYDLSEAKKWLELYMKNNNLGSINDLREVNITMCSVARMKLRGLDLPERLNTYLDMRLSDRVETAKEADPKPTKTSTLPSLLEAVDNALDQFYRADYAYTKPDIQEALKKSGGRQADIKYTISWLESIIPQTKDTEFYPSTPKAKLRNYEKFLKDLITECEKYLGAPKPKVIRKTRPKKPAQLVKNVKFLKKWGEHTGQLPEVIIGASIVWLYNTKYKKLIKIVAGAGQRLSVRGTSIIEYDEKETVAKTVRKPEVIIPGMLSCPKNECVKTYKSLKTQEATSSGRLNEHTLILRAFK